MEEIAKKQGTTEVKCFNKDTELTSPDADWEFGEECEEDDEHYEHQPQDDVQCD